MAKKNKQKLQKLIVKKEILQKFEQSGTILSFSPRNEDLDERQSVEPLPQKSPKVIRNIIESKTPTHSITRDLRRTAVSLIIIILLLVGAAFASQKTSYDSLLGQWLFQVLHLKS